MADRVRRPADYEEMLTELRDRGVFKTYKDALVFAACLGFKRGRRVAFMKSSAPIDCRSSGRSSTRRIACRPA